jgi:hypothetical protein
VANGGDANGGVGGGPGELGGGGVGGAVHGRGGEGVLRAHGAQFFAAVAAQEAVQFQLQWIYYWRPSCPHQCTLGGALHPLHTQVKLKKRGSDTNYLATVLAIGTECGIGVYGLFCYDNACNVCPL